jgi:hypothetical protein
MGGDRPAQRGVGERRARRQGRRWSGGMGKRTSRHRGAGVDVDEGVVGDGVAVGGVGGGPTQAQNFV